MEKKKENNSNYILLVVVCLLFVFSAFQAVQISTVEAKITTGGIVSGNAPATSSYNPQVAQATAPSMVGGC